MIKGTHILATHTEVPKSNSRRYSVIEELYRLFAMQLILRPVTKFFPKSVAVFSARIMAALLLFFPSLGLRLYWQARGVFDLGRIASISLARKRLASDFVSFVVNLRICNRTERVYDWNFVQENRDPVDRLFRAGQTVIIATAHFNRHLLAWTLMPEIMPAHQVHVSTPPPEQLRSIRHFIEKLRSSSFGSVLHDARLGLQYRTYMRAGPANIGDNTEHCWVGEGISGTRTIRKRLNERGNVVYIHVDAPQSAQKSGTYVRPFAAEGKRVMSMGAARLSHRTGCPIVPLIFWEEADRSVKVKWGNPIISGRDYTKTMDGIIDQVEIAIGQRPEQYPPEIGFDRRWNSARLKWEESID